MPPWSDVQPNLHLLTETHTVTVDRPGKPPAVLVKVWPCCTPFWLHGEDKDGKLYTACLWGNSAVSIKPKTTEKQ